MLRLSSEEPRVVKIEGRPGSAYSDVITAALLQRPMTLFPFSYILPEAVYKGQTAQVMSVSGLLAPSVQ